MFSLEPDLCEFFLVELEPVVVHDFLVVDLNPYHDPVHKFGHLQSDRQLQSQYLFTFLQHFCFADAHNILDNIGVLAGALETLRVPVDELGFYLLKFV